MSTPTCEVVAISLQMAKFMDHYNDACSASHLDDAELKNRKLPGGTEQMNDVAQHCEDRVEALRGMLSFARCSSLKGAITLMAACRWNEAMARDMKADADGDSHSVCEAQNLERKADRMWNEAIRFIAQKGGVVDSDALYEMTGIHIKPDTMFDHEEVVCEQVSVAMRQREPKAKPNAKQKALAHA